MSVSSLRAMALLRQIDLCSNQVAQVQFVVGTTPRPLRQSQPIHHPLFALVPSDCPVPRSARYAWIIQKPQQVATVIVPTKLLKPPVVTIRHSYCLLSTVVGLWHPLPKLTLEGDMSETATSHLTPPPPLSPLRCGDEHALVQWSELRLPANPTRSISTSSLPPSRPSSLSSFHIRALHQSHPSISASRFHTHFLTCAIHVWAGPCRLPDL